MTVPESGSEPPGRRAGRAGQAAAGRGLAVRDAAALIFAADMYGVQLDQLALLTSGERAARAAAASPATRSATQSAEEPTSTSSPTFSSRAKPCWVKTLRISQRVSSSE